ncbi:DMT family transporter [Nocardia sp. NBC_00416]|uniref:DMT family transporter n=1 Tax=Nocardia sp. NBC_00416 TaxID=2975991 RepID=UPI002E24A485
MVPGDDAALRNLATGATVRPLLVCAVSTGLFQAAFLSSVSRTGAALATVTALGAAWMTGTVAAVAGCALLPAPVGGARMDPLGLLLAVAAGTCYGLYTVCAGQMAAANRAADLPALSALALLLGSLPLVPWMISDSTPLRGTALALIAWLGLATTTAAAYWLFTAGLVRVRATTAGTLGLAEPLAAAVIGVLLLHERLSPLAWGGCALILAGMITTCLPQTPRGRDSAHATKFSKGVDLNNCLGFRMVSREVHDSRRSS